MTDSVSAIGKVVSDSRRDEPRVSPVPPEMLEEDSRKEETSPR